MCRPSRFFSATPAPQVTWSPLDLKLAYTCVSTNRGSPPPDQAGSARAAVDFHLTKDPELPKVARRLVRGRRIEWRALRNEQLAPHHVLARHDVQRVGGPEDPQRVLRRSNTFSRSICTLDTLGAGTAGGGWLDCARLVAAETPDAVAIRTARPRSDRTLGLHELNAGPRSEPQHRRERIMQAARTRL